MLLPRPIYGNSTLGGCSKKGAPPPSSSRSRAVISPQKGKDTSLSCPPQPHVAKTLFWVSTGNRTDVPFIVTNHEDPGREQLRGSGSSIILIETSKMAEQSEI